MRDKKLNGCADCECVNLTLYYRVTGEQVTSRDVYSPARWIARIANILRISERRGMRVVGRLP
jgi:hypothetical protein